MKTVIDLRGRHFLTLADYSADEIRYLLDLAAELKRAKKEGREEPLLAGKEIALIFEKDSTRTRCAFEVAAYDQGAHVTFIGPTGSHMGHKETVKDTARVLGRMYDAIEYRGFGEQIADDLAEWAGVPVYNGLTDEWHPTQILADFLTMREHSPKPLEEMVSCYLGDARFNMADTYLVGGAKLGMDVRIAAPESLWPSEEFTSLAYKLAGESGASVTITEDVARGRERLRLPAHRRLGLDGRAGGGVEGADRAPDSVPDQRGDDGADRQPGHQVHALPAGVPQHGHAGRPGAVREVRARGARGDGRRLRVAGVDRVRRGREPAAHDQGGAWSRPSGDADDARRRRARRQRAPAPRPGADGGEPA